MIAFLVLLAALPSESLDARLRQAALHEAQAQVARQEERDPAGYHFDVRRVSPLPPAADASTEFAFSHLSRKELGGPFFATFRLSQEGRPVGSVRVDLDGRWSGALLTSVAPLPRKSVPASYQITPRAFEGTPPPGALSVWPKGHRLRQGVPAGKVLTWSDLEPIPLVSQGDRVRLLLCSGSLSIATDALAKGQGGLGDRIRVELPNHKALQAHITGLGEVRLAWREGP